MVDKGVFNIYNPDKEKQDLMYPLKKLKLATIELLVMCSFCPILMGAEEDEEDEIYSLPAFTVTQDRDVGYLSTNSTAGTSLNTLVRDLPMSLEIVNRELIEDLHATDFREALAYSAGISFETFENRSIEGMGVSGERSPSSSVNVGDPLANAIIIRGYSVPNQQRLGFRIGATVNAYGVVLGGSTDTVNIDRLEVVKGPQALLYGINVLSGVVNILPRMPLSEKRTRMSIGVGGDDYFRTTLDHTGPVIKDTLNFRVVGAYQENGDWTDYKDDEKRYGALQFDWKITPKLNLFLEGQYARFDRRGGGQQFFTDSGGQRNSEFLNPYDERYSFGRDFNNSDVLENDITLPTSESDLIGELGGNTRSAGQPLLIQKPGQNYAFPDLGPGYRISGPDVSLNRREHNFLALATLQPFKDLDIEIGAYKTHQETEEVNVRMNVFSNSYQTVQPSLNNSFGWAYNPEVASNFDPNTGKMRDVYGYGIGELFISENPAPGAPVGSSVVDRKYASYYWYKKPQSSDGLQLRTRIAYTFETDFLVRARHTFSAGANYIKDEVSFVHLGTEDGLVYSRGSSTTGYTDNRLSDDPYQFRNLFDYSVIRYNGEQMAIPGFVNTNNLGGLTVDNAYVVRSGWIDADLWFKGIYGLYNGRFWNERINVILGIRQDSYQAKESEQLRVIDRDKVTEDWMGSGYSGTGSSMDFSMTDVLVGYGNQAYTARPDLPDSLNANVANSIAELQANQPNGTVRYSFDEAQKYTTGNFGLSFRVTDSFSVYYNFSEGIFPNTGLKDAQNRAIEAEQTRNNEIGMKFEILDGKISGGIALYRIERSNAVWSWGNAPNPSKWAGGPSPSAPSDSDRTAFNINRIQSGELGINVGAYEKYLRTAYDALGMTFPERRGSIDLAAMKDYGAVHSTTISGLDPTKPDEAVGIVVINYDKMKEVDALMQTGATVRIGYDGQLAGTDEPGIELPAGNPLKLAMDLAVRDQTSAYVPINTGGGQIGTDSIHNASNWRGLGANITFEEEGTGIDGHFIFSPIPNYQILFSFSHQKREVTGNGFNLLPGYQVLNNGDTVDNTQWTNEYDVWVYYLGPENFTDPTDPSTFTGGSVKGLNLSMVPETTFSLWNKYTFIEGPLERLSIGGGMRYDSQIPTSIAVGGEGMGVNRFRTSDVPERFVFDMMLGYRFFLGKTECELSLKVENLLNDDSAEVVTRYDVENEDPIFRRTRVYYYPRNFRLSLSMNF